LLQTGLFFCKRMPKNGNYFFVSHRLKDFHAFKKKEIKHSKIQGLCIYGTDKNNHS